MICGSHDPLSIEGHGPHERLHFHWLALQRPALNSSSIKPRLSLLEPPPPDPLVSHRALFPSLSRLRPKPSRALLPVRIPTRLPSRACRDVYKWGFSPRAYSSRPSFVFRRRSSPLSHITRWPKQNKPLDIVPAGRHRARNSP